MECKKRKQNWNPAALGVLIEGVEINYGTLKGKLSSSLTKSSKDKVWDNIRLKVNSVSSDQHRTIEEIKKKWSDYSSGLKKKEGARRKEMRKTGRGDAPPDLTDIEQKMINIIGDVAIDGVIGGIDTMDSDMQNTSSSSTSASAIEVVDLVLTPQDSAASITDYTPNNKKSSKTANEEFLMIEREQLLTEKERLVIEKENMKINKERLEVEKERLKLARQKCSVRPETPDYAFHEEMSPVVKFY